MYVPHLLKEVRAIAAVGSDPSRADYRQARPVRTFDRPQPKVLPIPKDQNELVVHAMWSVVNVAGTATGIKMAGFDIAGKTGTAHKQENGGYAADKYIASFVGLAPVSAPRVIIGVMIDEPAGGYYGGSVAAPVFAEVMQATLRLLGVPHDAPLEPLERPGALDEPREST